MDFVKSSAEIRIYFSQTECLPIRLIQSVAAAPTDFGTITIASHNTGAPEKNLISVQQMNPRPTGSRARIAPTSSCDTFAGGLEHCQKIGANCATNSFCIHSPEKSHCTLLEYFGLTLPGETRVNCTASCPPVCSRPRCQEIFCVPGNERCRKQRRCGDRVEPRGPMTEYPEEHPGSAAVHSQIAVKTATARLGPEKTMNPGPAMQAPGCVCSSFLYGRAFFA
jgi:hypothetical protein